MAGGRDGGRPIENRPSIGGFANAVRDAPILPCPDGDWLPVHYSVERRATQHAGRAKCAGMTRTRTCRANPPDHHPVADVYVDQFFRGGKPVEPKSNP
jgi:hypothetical protein